jgi:hypothetical protein
LAVSLASACAPVVPPTTVVAPRSSAPSAPSGDASGPTRRLRSRALDIPIELRLPDRDTWQVDERSWLVAKQASTGSELALRTWRAERLVRRTDCVAQARLARPSLPVVNDEAVIERRPFTAPAGFESELVVGVEPSATGVTGYALVVGSSVGRCYAAVFVTRAAGAGSEQAVAARLGSAVDAVFPSVRVRSVDERAVRRRLVSRQGE